MDKLEEGYYYHIYNRGAGKADTFWADIDFKKFLEKYYYYMFISTDLYSYCLLKNHFHFLIRIRTESEQEKLFKRVKEKFQSGTFYGDNYPEFTPLSASVQIRHLSNSYTRFINTKHNRSGTLFEGTFKRVRINDESHFNHIVCYIHRNPIHHKITNSYKNYPFSSYNQFLTLENEKSLINKKKVLRNFGGIKNFVEAHEEFKANLGDDYYLE